MGMPLNWDLLQGQLSDEVQRSHPVGEEVEARGSAMQVEVALLGRAEALRWQSPSWRSWCIWSDINTTFHCLPSLAHRIC